MQKGANSLLRSVGQLRRAYDLLTDCINDIPLSGSPVKKAAIIARNRVEKSYMDILTAPGLGDEYRNVVRTEWQTDGWTTEAIQEKIIQLDPQARETVETLLDALIAGETIEIAAQ
jgi:hypothetical protein